MKLYYCAHCGTVYALKRYSCVVKNCDGCIEELKKI